MGVAGKYFFRLSSFQGEAFLKNNIQDCINQFYRELEFWPGKDVTIFIENLRII